MEKIKQNKVQVVVISILVVWSLILSIFSLSLRNHIKEVELFQPKLIEIVNRHDVILKQIVDFLNQAVKASQQVGVAQPAPEVAPAPVQ